MDLFLKEFTKLKDDERLDKYKIRINFIGRIYLFPQMIQQAMKALMEKTKNNDGYIVNFAMAYGGRSEIVDAAKKIAEQVKQGKLNIDQINEELFSKNLYISSEPDLIIRTSETRLSGFLPWQGVYSELIFLPDLLWPEFEKEHFQRCIEEYQERKRKFGK